MRWLIGMAVITSGFVGAASAADWPAFRGPQGNGISQEAEAPLEWNATKNVKWKTPLPRPGNGSPIVSAGYVFVACAEDAEGRARSLYCFDRKTGEKVWTKTVAYDKEDPTHETNPYGGSTPAADGKRVVVWHGSAGLYCYDFSGKELWKKDLGEFRHMWGYGTSPVIHDDRVILHPGPGKRIFMAAFALADGNELWRTEEPQEGTGESRPQDKGYVGSWATPVIAKIEDKLQAICTMPTRVVSYDVDDGKILWWCEGNSGRKGDLAYSSPVIANDVCVSVGGFNGPAMGFKLGGAGDISRNVLWQKEPTPQSIGSGVVVDGYFYRPNTGPDTIDCLDPKTGKIKWTEHVGNFWGSIVFAGDRCYATNQEGTTIVFKPSPDRFELIGKNPLGEPSNSTPAPSDGEMFLRTHKHVFCIGKP